MIWWPLPKQCHCECHCCSRDAVLFQKLWELSWQKYYLSVFTWSRMTKVWEAYSPKHISDHGPIMNADDKTEILLSFVDRSNAEFIKETVRSCHSPVVTDLENPHIQFFSKKWTQDDESRSGECSYHAWENSRPFISDQWRKFGRLFDLITDQEKQWQSAKSTASLFSQLWPYILVIILVILA